MAKLKIRWTETAVVEFTRMLTFYDARNGNTKYSRSIMKMVRDSLKLVVRFPQMFRAVDAEELSDVRIFHTKIICAVLVYNGCFYFVFMYSLSQ